LREDKEVGGKREAGGRRGVIFARMGLCTQIQQTHVHI